MLVRYVQGARASIGSPNTQGGVLMTDERTTAKAFHDAGGVDDWRVLFWGAYAYFPVSSFAQGARFVGDVAATAQEIGHFPDVDLRPEGVTVHTFSRADGARSEKDIELA